MKKFTASVLRTSYAWHEIEITAASEAEARATVLDVCGDREYKEKDVEYSIEQVSEQKKTVSMKTSELSGAALDWAVTKCEGFNADLREGGKWGRWGWDTDWGQGGPIIEREGIGFTQFSDYPQWTAKHPQAVCFDGPTPLIAAMRCYVASVMGDNIDIPKELT